MKNRKTTQRTIDAKVSSRAKQHFKQWKSHDLVQSFTIVVCAVWVTLLVINWRCTTSHLPDAFVKSPSGAEKTLLLPNELIAQHNLRHTRTINLNVLSEPSIELNSGISNDGQTLGTNWQTSNRSVPHDQVVWLDAITKTQFEHQHLPVPSLLSSSGMPALSIVYPAEWKNDPLMHWDRYVHARQKIKAEAKVLQVSWDRGARRLFGIADKTVSPEEGGRSVSGHWPELLSGLTYIAMVKCGHTKLMNAVGDLRQRLSGASLVLAKASHDVTSVLQSAIAAQTKSSNTTHEEGSGAHIVFALVRDPVDRWLSGTCHEMSLGLDKRLINECFVKRSPGHVPTGSQMLDCAMSQNREKNQWEYHQQLQSYQLINAATMVEGLAVTVAPFESTINSILSELGGTTEKMRDRRNDKAYRQRESMIQFCGLNAKDLTTSQLKGLCELLQPDVHMMTHYLNMTVPLCEQEF